MGDTSWAILTSPSMEKKEKRMPKVDVVVFMFSSWELTLDFQDCSSRDWSVDGARGLQEGLEQLGSVSVPKDANASQVPPLHFPLVRVIALVETREASIEITWL